MDWLGIVSYGAAALLYSATAIIIVVGRPGSRGAWLLVAAVVVSAVWAGGLAVAILNDALSPFVMVALDAIHLVAWTVCVLSWLGPPPARRWLAAASLLAAVSAIALSWSAAPSSAYTLTASVRASFLLLVLMALIGFLAVEQVYRNAREDMRRQLKLLCFAVGGVAAVDLFVYSHTALFGAPQPVLWDLRGFANALFSPLIVLGARRQKGWEREPFVSRHVMFYTTSMLGVGMYLVAMGFVAYFIRALGRQWSFPLDIAFLVAGLGVLAIVLFSGGIRARLRVALIKHFYRSKYDYRAEWLRLTRSLSRTGDLLQSAASGLEGMASIIGSERADLWVERDGHHYEWLVALGSDPEPKGAFERQHALVSFLASTGWVIDSEEYALAPDRYRTAFGHPDDGLLPPNSLVVPLDRQGYLQGFVIFEKPPGLRSLNFDDHDILKTAGRQVAAVLGQALAQEKLAETRQFEALNRLSAFLMHDLKNIVAQQELVVANAQRFRHRPEFIDDAFATIRGGTERIKRVLEQLAAGSRRAAVARVDVSKVLIEVRSQCSDRRPIPDIDMQAPPSWVRMDRDELVSAIVHLVRNAQDATPPDGRIRIDLRRSGGELIISVTDTGAGMDPAFLRDRLFRPFDSTKGAEGMGIGAYQARHVVRQAGGELDVTSAVGVGTTFAMRLPIAD